MYTFIEQDTGPLRVFRLPEPGMVYTIGADAATGLSHDYSVAQVMTNTLPSEQVAIYRSQLPTNEFSRDLDRLGKFYNEALIVCEINYPGNSVQEALLQYYKYPRNYQAETHLDEDVDVSTRYGFRTTESSKWLLINEFQQALVNDEVVINDNITIDEFRNFVYTSGKRKTGAAEGCNDDCVIALMLAYHGVKLYPFIMPRADKDKIIQFTSKDNDTKKAWRLFREKLDATERTERIVL